MLILSPKSQINDLFTINEELFSKFMIIINFINLP